MFDALAEPTRPVLRYHGGKWLLAPWIIGHFPAHRIYTEAYGGAASVLLQKSRSVGEVYNDLYGDVVELFRILRDEERAARLIAALELTPFAREEFVSCGARSIDPIEQARRLIVRSFQGYGSDSIFGNVTGFRSCANNNGGTPARDWANYPSTLRAIVARLKGVSIDSKPATELIVEHDSDQTLHYVDPPYVHSTRSAGNTYCQKHRYAFEMSDDDHRELARILRSCRGMVVLSGYPSTLYDLELYPDWRRVARSAYADGAEKRTEVLWINPAASSRLQPSLMEGL